MRISGGKARGIPLRVPKGDAVRPATDGLRQSVFSSLGERVVGATFVDFCAGSGSYGLEALSRGAAGGVAVEKSAKALECLRANRDAVAKSAGFASAVLAISACDLAQWQPAPDFRATLFFADPPYDRIPVLAPIVFAKASSCADPGGDALFVFEMPGEQSVAVDGWQEVKRIGRGGGLQPTAVIYRRNSA